MLLKLVYLFCFVLVLSYQNVECYFAGAGIFDVTGPATDILMVCFQLDNLTLLLIQMGYAKFDQYTRGIHLRLFSRAFIIKQDDSDTSRPIVFINLDAGMTSQAVKDAVIQRLQSTYNSEFDHTNVLISATHTHSGPGGYFGYLFYSISSHLFVKKSHEALVDGIYQSVVIARDNMRQTKLFISSGPLYNASINRSPTAYLANSEEERSRYPDNVDHKMTLIKFVDPSSNKPFASINWFAVHGVSMNKSNHFISSDNKGFASILFEARMNDQTHGTGVGKGPFVAAFAQANEGDVSPNTAGPRCIDTGLPCDLQHSTCNGDAKLCIAFGPGDDMFESTKIIAQRQVEKAWAQTGNTCLPAFGESFAAGTTDGPGIADFFQGELEDRPVWKLIRDLIAKPSPKLLKCHAPKPVLLPLGELVEAKYWAPTIVATQILRIGQLLIIGVPGEFTTMSGRRIREAVESTFNDHTGLGNQVTSSGPKIQSVIAGLSNTYSSYIATPEEYSVQRYEGASTMFGPLTLPAYVDQFTRLARALAKGTPLDLGPNPTNVEVVEQQVISEPPLDTKPFWQQYGQVLRQPKPVYSSNETVSVYFRSASPRNDVKRNSTYLTVECYDQIKSGWNVVLTDADWETKIEYHTWPWYYLFWARSTEARISWSIDPVLNRQRILTLCPQPIFRIQHFGTAHVSDYGQNRMQSFVGTSSSFAVRL